MTRRSPALFISALVLVLWLLALTMLETNFTAPAYAAAHTTVVIVDEGFESTFPPSGWNADGHWGKSDCETYTGAASAWIEGAASDRGCNGLDRVYHPNESARLRYGPFDLSNALTATLTFDVWLWQQIGDSFLWGASLDGTSFTGITVTEGFATTWAAQTLDLAAVPGLGDLRGQSNVYIGFVWQADDFGETFGGAFIDNVRVVKGVASESETATAAPTHTSTLTQTATPGLYLPAVSNAPTAAPPTLTPAPTNSPMPTTTSAPGNHAPVFPTPFLAEKVTEYQYDTNGRLVGAVTTITITTPATDQDGDSLTYGWSASNGAITGNGLTATWQRVIESGRVKKGSVTVIASDGRGGSAQVNFEVN